MQEMTMDEVEQVEGGRSSGFLWYLLTDQIITDGVVFTY